MVHERKTRRAIAVAVLSIAFGHAAVAHGDVELREQAPSAPTLYLRAEPMVAALLGDPQWEEYRSLGGGVAAKIGYGLATIGLAPVALEVRGYYLGFAGDANTDAGSAFVASAGVRVSPFSRESVLGGLYVDGHAGLARTGSLNRLALDVAVGHEFDVEPWRISPFVSYAHIASPERMGFDTTDAKMLLAGVSVGFDIDRQRAPGHAEVAPTIAPEPPMLDTDGDGILDRDDECPKMAEDFDGYRDDDGCVDEDNDADQILDVVDACPDNAETYNRHEDEDGCPDPEAGRAHIDKGEGKVVIYDRVFFDFNSDRIQERSFEVLDGVAEVLAGFPDVRVAVEGHTDDVGGIDFNLDLSQRRAESVRRYLVEHGIDEARLESRGFGEARPLQQGTSEEARAANRRVEFLIRAP